MKKLVFFYVFILFVFSLSLGAADLGSESIDLDLNVANESRYEIGFSNIPVTSFSQAVSQKSEIELVGVYNQATSNYDATDNAYVYWKIVSPDELDIKLRIGNHLTSSSNTNGIEWTVSRADVAEGETPFTIGSVAEGEESEEVVIATKEATDLNSVGSVSISVNSSININQLYNYESSRYSSLLFLEVYAK